MHTLLRHGAFAALSRVARGLPESARRVEVLRRVAGHLRPGGRILVSYIASESPPSRLPARLMRWVARLAGSDWRPEPGDVLGAGRGVPDVAYEHWFEPGEFAREAARAGLCLAFHEPADGIAALVLADAAGVPSAPDAAPAR